MRTYIYVDGFNLYYGALKGRPFRWLDLVELARQVLPHGHSIDRIKYFTARVSGASDPKAPARQHRYLSTLGTSRGGDLLWKLPGEDGVAAPNESTHRRESDKFARACDVACRKPYGHGGAKTHLACGQLSTAGRPKKETAQSAPTVARCLNRRSSHDGRKGFRCEPCRPSSKRCLEGCVRRCPVFSNDTDLEMPIRMVTTERNKIVNVVCPGRWPVAPRLERVATHTRHIHRRMLQAAQLPDPIPRTTIAKPTDW